MKTYTNKSYDKHTYFWGGVYSQWHKHDITIDGITFNCCEQYMMYRKAMVFNDIACAKKILNEKDPREQKKLGRSVANFIPSIWESVARDFVFRANMAKFGNDYTLRAEIFSTENTLLVEASPYDTIWGIGFDEDAASKTPVDEWKGSNWLGLVLTEVRDTLMGIDTGMIRIGTV